jgi:hypothetical protein
VRGTCGSEFDSLPGPREHVVDDEPALWYVDPNHRYELERFEHWDDAELACDLPRSSGIACELSPVPLPGLPAEIILWVTNRAAALAWALLADAQREASKKDDDAS